jgi:hypothetical protein
MAARISAHAEASFPEEFKQAADYRTRREKRAEERMQATGPALWRILHSRALQPVPGGDVPRKLEIQWLHRFAEKVAHELCPACSAHMKSYMKQTPPDFDNYFEWTVELHNSVNEKRGVPTLDVEEARAIHTRP